MANKVRTAAKQLRIQLTDDDGHVIDEHIFELPRDFVSVNNAHPHWLKATWQANRPLGFPTENYQLEERPAEFPYYPLSYQLTDSGLIYQRPMRRPLDVAAVFDFVECGFPGR